MFQFVEMSTVHRAVQHQHAALVIMAMDWLAMELALVRLLSVNLP